MISHIPLSVIRVAVFFMKSTRKSHKNLKPPGLFCNRKKIIVGNEVQASITRQAGSNGRKESKLEKVDTGKEKPSDRLER